MAFSFSATAPSVSEKQEQAELKALTEEERQELDSDLHPSVDTLGGSQKRDALSIQTAVSMLTEALEMIPNHEKLAHTEAMLRVPDLVERESDPRAFLRCERWDARAAAKRLVLYWKVRKHLFKDRAFLPMTLDGAMAPDIHTLEKEIIICLPADDYGRRVTAIQRCKIKKGGGVDLKSLIRCRFYMLSSVAEATETQTIGHVLINNARGCQVYTHFDRAHARDIASVLNCLPINLATAHLVATPDKVTQQCLLPVVKFVLGKKWSQRCVLHLGGDQQFLTELEDVGIHKRNLPSFLGGELKTDYFETWLEQRRELERPRTAQPQPLND